MKVKAENATVNVCLFFPCCFMESVVFQNDLNEAL